MSGATAPKPRTEPRTPDGSKGADEAGHLLQECLSGRPALPARTRTQGGQGTSPDSKPAWWKPGMSAEDAAIWEAAERCAASAPELQPGDDVAIRLQQLYAGFPQWLQQYRAEHRGAA